jgi:hypothetical protein
MVSTSIYMTRRQRPTSPSARYAREHSALIKRVDLDILDYPRHGNHLHNNHDTHQDLYPDFLPPHHQLHHQPSITDRSLGEHHLWYDDPSKSASTHPSNSKPVATYGIAFVFVLLFTCWPVEAYWYRFTTSWMRTHTWKCHDEVQTLMIIISLSTFQDLIACILPMFVVQKLRLPFRQKLALAAIFLLGLG